MRKAWRTGAEGGLYVSIVSIVEQQRSTGELFQHGGTVAEKRGVATDNIQR